jgi:hypothetical protein
LIRYGSPPAAPTHAPLTLGVVVRLGPLDTFAHARILSLARREIDALLEDRETTRPWDFSDVERAALRDDEDTRAAVFSYMRSVLIADQAVSEIAGIEGPDGQPVRPSFELFRWLFRDPRQQAAFALVTWKTEQLWVDEGNASGPAQPGSGATPSTTAPPAGP